MHAAHRSGKDVVDGFISRPTAGGERPAIVLVHGYRGLDGGQRAVTRRFAQEGFVCLSPDLFHGRTYHTLEDCALKKTSLDIPRAVSHIVDSVPYLRKLPWVGKKKVAVLGLAFKPDSDDVRDSPALDVAVQLHGRGAAVVATDPQATQNAQRMHPQLTFEQDVIAAVTGADAVVVVTEWKQYRALDPVALRALVRTPVIVDGRNCLDAAAWRAAGWTYRGLGRP